MVPSLDLEATNTGVTEMFFTARRSPFKGVRIAAPVKRKVGMPCTDLVSLQIVRLVEPSSNTMSMRVGDISPQLGVVFTCG
jgi:hypothetical protein